MVSMHNDLCNRNSSNQEKSITKSKLVKRKEAMEQPIVSFLLLLARRETVFERIPKNCLKHSIKKRFNDLKIYLKYYGLELSGCNNFEKL